MYNEIWEFWEIASSHCPFHPCLAHVLSSLEALPWILLTQKVACTSRHPIWKFWPQCLCLLFFFFFPTPLQLNKWFHFSWRSQWMDFCWTAIQDPESGHVMHWISGNLLLIFHWVRPDERGKLMLTEGEIHLLSCTRFIATFWLFACVFVVGMQQQTQEWMKEWHFHLSFLQFNFTIEEC